MLAKRKLSKSGGRNVIKSSRESNGQGQGRDRRLSPTPPSHREVVYHPLADQNSRRPNQVLYRAINPTPTPNPSIIRVRNAREDAQTPHGNYYSEASGRPSSCSEPLRRTSWPPPRLHMRSFQKMPVPRESFFEAMEDLVPCAEVLSLQSGGTPAQGRGRGRPMSW